MFGEIDKSESNIIVNSCSSNNEENFCLSLKKRIISCIAKNESITIKSQQKHEPDFTHEERERMCTEILEDNPSQFLFRFGKYLQREHLQYFNKLSGNEELKHYILETQKQLNESTTRTKRRNIRFIALNKMKASSQSNYFAEDEMRKREPLLYKELVTDNLTDEERLNEAALSSNSTRINTFSDFLLEQLDRKQVQLRQEHQERMEEDCCEEDEEDHESDEEDMITSSSPNRPVDASEKELLRSEFHSSLYSRFISGRDRDFDYSKIDQDVADNERELLELESRDEEERYFDEEEPRLCSEIS